MATTCTDSENAVTQAVESNHLLIFLRKKGLSQADVEEVKQETALRILRISRKRGHEFICAPYVYAVAKNVIHELRRSTFRTMTESSEAHLDEIVACHDIDETIFLDLSTDIRNSLNDSDRSLLDLLLTESSVQDVARALQVTLSVVTKRKSRLEARIKALLMSQTQLS